MRGKKYATEEERIAARRARQKAYAFKHRERRAAAVKAWRLANPDKGYNSDPERFKAYVQKYKDNNREKIRAIDLERYHTIGRYKQYGLTRQQFEQIWDAQGGLCAVCPKGLERTRTGCHVDHDHLCCPMLPACGRCVRGLLCQKCNLGLGHLDDDPVRLLRGATYLQAYLYRREQTNKEEQEEKPKTNDG